MTTLSQRMGRGWRAAGTGTRLWWSGVASVGAAGALLFGGVAVAGAAGSGSSNTAGAARAPSATGATAPAGATASKGAMAPTGAMAGMAGTGAMAGMAGTGAVGPSASTADTICPNVQGATVMTNGMVMAPVPSTPPTAAQQAAAAQLVTAVEQGVAQYADVATAEADGYHPISARRGPMTHYLDKAVIGGGDVLDPSHPSALMFANTVNGPVLVGAMFLGPAPCVPGPDIGGSLTQWHAHDNLCFAGGQLVGQASAGGTCTVGSRKDSSYFMLHVWTAPQLAAQYQFQADLPPSAYAAIDSSGQA